MKHMRDCDVSESEIIKGATVYPAEWLGVQDRLGSIAVGKQANILVVNKNPLENIENIQSTFLVVQNGRITETQ
jgi:imidazolonepropionase-like amidohydrolase